MLEKDLLDKCRRWAKGRGCKVVKIHGGPFMEAGLPDLFIFCPGGKFMACEMKRPGEKPTKLQEIQLAEFRRLGFHAFWCDDFEDFKENLRSVDK